MNVVKRISGFKVQVGGQQHSGWLPAHAATPQPIPVREVIFDLEITCAAPNSYLLCYRSWDGAIGSDSWHQTLQEAEEAAMKNFGATHEQWREEN